MELWATATSRDWKVSVMIEELRDTDIDLGNLTVRHPSVTGTPLASHSALRTSPVILGPGPGSGAR